MQFEELRLNEPLLRAVRAAGYQTPTPIQVNAIPIALAGRDVLGCAQTGTGKTAAFALPVLQRLSEGVAGAAGAAGARTAHANGRANDTPRQPAGRSGRGRPAHRTGGAPSPCNIRALVLCPTRELAQQIHSSFVTYGAHTGIRMTAVYGGVNQNPQVRAIRAGADVLIATPGRLLDLMNQGFVNLAGVEMLVLDEADRMLDMGFLPDIRRILSQIPQQRQSLLFSATMPAAIRALADDMLRDPVPVEVARISSPAETVSHWVYHVQTPQKTSLLMHLLASIPRARALVFTRTKHGADRLTRHLLAAGVPAAALHGNKSQGARNRALDEFRSAKTPVLVATDLAARGLDVEDIAQVINYDLTRDPEAYVHRIGRTGRAGAAGTAISFCTDQERGDLRAIERLLRLPLQRVVVPPLKGDTRARPSRPQPARQEAARKPDRQRRVEGPRVDSARRSSRGRRRRDSGRTLSA